MARMVGKVLRVILIVIGVLAIVAMGGLYVLLETQAGHDFLLRHGLARANQELDGEISVGGVHSAGILRGLTLTDVQITGLDGKDFLRADSARAGYGLVGLLRGSVIISPAELWRPRIVVERLHGEAEFNVERIFRTGGEGPADPGERRIAVERVKVHDGEFILRMPVEEGDEPIERSVVEEGPDGGLMQRYTFTSIEGDIPQILIREPNWDGEYIRIEQLSMIAGILDEPFEISDFRGRLERVGSRLSFDADRIWLSRTELAGEGWIDWGGAVVSLDLDLDADILHLEDFHWIDPDLPAVTGRLSVRGTGPLDEGFWMISNADLELGGSRVRGSGGVQLGTPIRLVEVDATADPLLISELERFLPEPLPLSGALTGRVQAEGPLGALSVDGRVSLEAPGSGRPPSTATFAGLLHTEGAFGVTDFSLLVDPFHFGVLAELDPSITLRGEGSVFLEAEGRLDSGLTFVADVSHMLADLPPSRVTAHGSVTGDLRDPSGDVAVDVEGALEALSLATVAHYYPDIPVSGVAAGTFALRGRLADLDVTVRMETPAGPVVADARFDAFDPGAHYRVEASVGDFELSRLYSDAPEPTRLSGSAFLDGRGLDPESMWASARVELGATRIGHLAVDTAATFLRIDGGIVTFDTILVQTSVMDVGGSGALALAEGAPAGEVRVGFTSESLAGLRPFFMGDTIIAADTLTPIERASLEMAGRDIEAFSDEDELAVGGRLVGSAVLRGSIHDFRTDGTITLEEVEYGEHFLRDSRINFYAERLRTPDWGVSSTLTADSIGVFGRHYEGVFAEADYRGRGEQGDGHVFLRILRDAEEDYRVRAGFELDPTGGVVHLDEFTLRFDAVQWNLGTPSTITWSDEAVTVRDLRLIRPGIDGMRIEADGTLPYDGPIDFRLMVDSLNVSRVAQLAQLDSELGGVVSLGLEIGGETRAPVMSGKVFARDLRYDEFFLSSIEGDLGYADRLVSGDLEAWQDGRRVFTLSGGAPLDLAFADIENRLLDAPMSLTVMVDEFPAANALAFLEDMQDVQGIFNGQMDVAGTPRNPSPTGSLQLRRGAVTLPELGVRYTGVQANLLLDADGRVLVNAEAVSRGTARVEGTVQLDPASDPGFDLLIVTNNFLAVDRRDMTARLGGEVTLSGRYTRPALRGDVRVEQSILFLDEFVRAADVIDLTDASIFEVVDTSIVASRPLIEAQNPFMRNLELDVNLVVTRDTWLRSREINVEIGGELAVNYDRSRNEIILGGSLQAIRGAYTAFGRQFQVREGTVDFVGTPGIDPNLNFQAVNRLRTEGGEPLDIIAVVQGTLTNPRVQLSSETQPPIAESDLVSYLIFGRPSYALQSGERSILQGTGGAAFTLGAGALATQLGSIVAQQVGIDYFAVTQADRGLEAEGDRGLGGQFAGTQAEVGHYLFENLFVAVTARPPVGAQAQSLGWLQGARAEWRFSDLWTVESFIEDRFSRAGVSGFTDVGIRHSRVVGLSIFREWGY